MADKLTGHSATRDNLSLVYFCGFTKHEDLARETITGEDIT